MPPKGVPMTPEHRAKISASQKRPAPTEKRCPGCRTVKPADQFGKRSKNSHHLRGQCRTCEAAASRSYAAAHPEQVRERNRQGAFRRRGITEKIYLDLTGQQNGRCAICGEPAPPRKRLAVDHDHATGEIRGLLCDNCNHGLGKFRDDADRLRAAIAYLEGPGPVL